MNENLSINVLDIIKERIAEVDVNYIVRSEVINIINKTVIGTIDGIVENEAKIMVYNEIRKVLDGEINTDDGWGKKVKYNSFAEMFKAEVKKNIDGQWQVKREIEGIVKKRIEELIKPKAKEIYEKIATELMK